MTTPHQSAIIHRKAAIEAYQASIATKDTQRISRSWRRMNEATHKALKEELKGNG